MRALIQRTFAASVTVDGRVIGEIGLGLVVFVCAMRGDGEGESEWLARKTVNLRIFRDEEGRMNRSLLDVGGSALIVSQFTLAAETKGNRPGFSTAAAPEEGKRLYEHFSAEVRNHGVVVATGIFGADMKVALVERRPGDDLARYRHPLTGMNGTSPSDRAFPSVWSAAVPCSGLLRDRTIRLQRSGHRQVRQAEPPPMHPPRPPNRRAFCFLEDSDDLLLALARRARPPPGAGRTSRPPRSPAAAPASCS